MQGTCSSEFLKQVGTRSKLFVVEPAKLAGWLLAILEALIDKFLKVHSGTTSANVRTNEQPASLRRWSRPDANRSIMTSLWSPAPITSCYCTLRVVLAGLFPGGQRWRYSLDQLGLYSLSKSDNATRRAALNHLWRRVPTRGYCCQPAPDFECHSRRRRFFFFIYIREACRTLEHTSPCGAKSYSSRTVQPRGSGPWRRQAYLRPCCT